MLVGFIATKVLNSNPTHGKVNLIQHYVLKMKLVSHLMQVGGFIGYSGFLHQ
jgi:hypothetical protein